MLREPLAYRVARATVSARDTLMAGITTVRDLGTEGAGYADVGLKQAIEDGIIPGPRMLVADAGDRGDRHLWAEGLRSRDGGAAGRRGSRRHRRRDARRRAPDRPRRRLVKIYADYRWGPNGEARPTFSVEEMSGDRRVGESSGRHVAAHASTAEGMRRAILAGVETIEHGDGGTPEVLQLMAEKGVTLCPTLAAGDATAQYAGWKKGQDPEPARLQRKRASVPGRDEGRRDDRASAATSASSRTATTLRELEMMVAAGVTPAEATRIATSGNAAAFHVGRPAGQREARPVRRPDCRGGRSDEGRRRAAAGALRDEGRPDLQAALDPADRPTATLKLEQIAGSG